MTDLIDFHNHVLPAVDDGSKSLEMSLSMLRHAADQGITDVVNTVHYQHPKVETDDISYDRIFDETKKLQLSLDNASIPITIHVGAEVFFLPNLMDLVDCKLATIGNGKYMLIEFLPHYIPESQKKVLFNLKMAGITPIIAHPERYRDVQQNIDMVRDWLRAGCLIQIDAGSILGQLGYKAEATSHEILKLQLCQLIGSDAHDNHRRNFCLADAIEYCKSTIDEKFANEIITNAKKVISGIDISPEFGDEPYDENTSLWSKLSSRLNLG